MLLLLPALSVVQLCMYCSINLFHCYSFCVCVLVTLQNNKHLLKLRVLVFKTIENPCHSFCHCGLLFIQVSLTFFGEFEFGQQFAEVGTGVLDCVACWLLFEGEAGGADDPVVPT